MLKGFPNKRIVIIGISVIKFLKHSYDYSELHIFNANNAIRSLNNDLSETNQFYILGGGLTQVPICQATQISKRDKSMIALKTQVRNWKYDSKLNEFHVNLYDLENDKNYKII